MRSCLAAPIFAGLALLVSVTLSLAAAQTAGQTPAKATFGLMKWTKTTFTQFVNEMLNMVFWRLDFKTLSQQDRVRLEALPSDVLTWAKKYPRDRDVPQYLFHTGYVIQYGPKGRAASAAKIYRFLVTNYPRSEYAAEAKVELKRLGY